RPLARRSGGSATPRLSRHHARPLAEAAGGAVQAVAHLSGARGMSEADTTIARMWAEHTSREIGAIIGRSAEYVRVRAQRLDLPRKREMRGGWQRKDSSALP